LLLAGSELEVGQAAQEDIHTPGLVMQQTQCLVEQDKPATAACHHVMQVSDLLFPRLPW